MSALKFLTGVARTPRGAVSAVVLAIVIACALVATRRDN